MRALEKHFPFTIAIFERSIKLVAAELPLERLPADRRAKRAVFANGPTNVRSIVRETSLPNDYRTLDRRGNFSRPTSPDGRCRRTGPLTVERNAATGGAGITEMRQEKNNRSHKHTLHTQTTLHKGDPD
jgi:hypothetical protein